MDKSKVPHFLLAHPVGLTIWL